MKSQPSLPFVVITNESQWEILKVFRERERKKEKERERKREIKSQPSLPFVVITNESQWGDSEGI